MTENKMRKITTYRVTEYSDDDKEIISEKYFPKHIYSFEDMINFLNGDLTRFDIEEGRFNKRGHFFNYGNGYFSYIDLKWIKCGGINQ